MTKPPFLEPQEILQKLELRKNMIACDFGAGAGGWVIPLAKKLRRGKVYALDVQGEALSALESQARLEEVYNIETILCDLEEIGGLKLKDSSADLVLMTNLLFQLENREQVFKEAKRVLKKDGKVLVVDWKEEAPLGPRQGRVSPEEVKKLAEEASLKLEEGFEAGDYHYGLIFTKP